MIIKHQKKINRYFATVATIYLIFLLFQPYSYSEMQRSDWNIVYNLAKKNISQNKWEEAFILFHCLNDTKEFYTEQEKPPELSQLEIEVYNLLDKNLNQLYLKGQEQLDNSAFSNALITFRKILYYDSGYQNVKELFEKAQALENALRGIKQKTIVVTSKTPDKRQTGLRIYKPDKCYNGYTLFTHEPLYNSPPINYIYLIDMYGKIVYQWAIEGSAVFARLTPDGYLFYINGSGLQGLDSESNVIWYYPEHIDHAFQCLEDGDFLIDHSEIRNNGTIPIGCPHIEIISPDKDVLWRWKGEMHTHEFENLLNIKILPVGDWDNNNTCEILKDTPLGRKDSRFREGNILFSYNARNIIGIIDRKSGEIVWAWGPGNLDGQHMPTMLDNGNILIFDNGTNRGWSRVIELNPLTEEIVWEYHSEPKEDFYTQEMGNAVPLPNGNILVCEAMNNRIFEITRKGEIVWDFISPFGRTISSYGIYRAYRYSSEYVKPLLDKIKQWQNQQRDN